MALALVEPTQYTTQLASRPYFLCPSHHNCHLRSLAELSSSSAPLWRMAAGTVSGSQHVGSGSDGGTSRSALGAIKAVGGVGIPTYFADLLWRGNYCTDTEFDDMDVLVIQFASSLNLDDESGLLEGVEAYTENFDAADSSNQFSANYSHAQCLDYILKYWQKWCFEQKDNVSSKWYGTQHGKPFRVMFVTHWHDARGYYNGPIREVAKRWGAAVCELDRKIGFSKDTPLPNGGQVSVVYAYDTQTIDGVVYGWHPARGSSGKYIQTRMANIFAQAINEWFK